MYLQIWFIRSSGMLRSLALLLVTDISGQSSCSILDDQAVKEFLFTWISLPMPLNTRTYLTQDNDIISSNFWLSICNLNNILTNWILVYIIQCIFIHKFIVQILGD